MTDYRIHSATEQPPTRASGVPTLAVTVVSSNESLLIPCLDTLLANRPDGLDLRIYVSWNGRARGLAALSADLVRRYPSVEMIDSGTSGFPPNQNMLLERVTADYYLVINDDLLFRPGSIEKPLAYMQREESRQVGMLTVRLLNADGSLQPSTYRFAGLFRTILSVSGLRRLIPVSPKLFRVAGLLGMGKGKSQYWSHDRTVEVDSCRGAYMLVRHDALRDVGLWDVKGGEETEWHMRFRQRGWKIVFFHEAEVVHLGSMTVSKDPAVELINVRSFLNIYHKHMPGWRYSTIRAVFWLTYAGKFAGALVRGQPERRDVARRGLAMIANWPREAPPPTLARS